MNAYRNLLAVVVLLVATASAHAVIIKLTPLKEVINAEQFIVIAKVEKLDPDKPSMVLTIADSLKGKAPFERLPVNLLGDAEGQKGNHTKMLLERVAVGSELVFFISKRGKRYIGFGYTNGTWFQMQGIPDAAEEKTIRWQFLHGEPYFRRTFKGTTGELITVIKDGLNGKEPPAPNEKEAPGFGPPLAREGKEPSNCGFFESAPSN